MNGFFPLHWADKSGNTRAGINGIIGNCIGGILYSDYKVFLNTSVLPTPFPIISSLSLFNRPANFKLRLLVDFSCTNYSNISETMSYHVIDRFEISKYSSFFNKTFRFFIEIVQSLPSLRFVYVKLYDSYLVYLRANWVSFRFDSVFLVPPFRRATRTQCNKGIGTIRICVVYSCFPLLTL